MAFLVTDNASDLASLIRLYTLGLDREPDANGLAFWAEVLDSGRLELDQIVERFENSREYNARFDADLTDEAFVDTLYTELLGREADEDGAAFYIGQLAAGASRAQLVSTFLTSAEAQANGDVVGEDGVEIGDFAPPTFGYGVASGDPDAGSVVLWTHVTADSDGPVEVTYEVSTDADFTDIVSEGTVMAGPETDYTAKAIADGLDAGGEYFYRFTFDGETSTVGQTRTLPEGALDMLEFAIFSCANYAAGFFNPYAEALARGFDYSIHLGDYIYESAFGGFGSSDPDTATRVPQPLNEVVTPEDYTARYATYHQDPDLQALRAAAPMIMMWDDHETANDSWETGAEAHDPETEGLWEDRRDAGLEAYFNWNPVREPENGDLRDYDGSFEFGDLATLHMLETRLQARDETRSDLAFTALPNKVGEYLADETGQAFAADLAANPQLIPEGVDPTDPAAIAALAADTSFVINLALTVLLTEANDPDREMIGEQQMAEFADQIAASETTWDIIGSQTLINNMEVPVALLLDQSPETQAAFGEIALKILTGQPLTPEEEALANGPKAPYNLDSWDGYKAEQNEIAEILVENDANAVVISGDTHNAWYSSFSTAAGEFAAMHFGGPGVSSPGLESILADLPSEDVAALFVAFIDSLFYAETASRGYLDMTVTPDAVSSDYVFVNNVDTIDYETFVETQTAGIELFA